MQLFVFMHPNRVLVGLVPNQNSIAPYISQPYHKFFQELVSFLVGNSGEAVQWLIEKFELNLSVLTQLGRDIIFVSSYIPSNWFSAYNFRSVN